jgi:hypothetical protein
VTAVAAASVSTAPPPSLPWSLDVRGDARAWAAFSPCGQYRYLLGRSWDPALPVMGIGMCNPSKAGGYDASGKEENDPTVRKVIGFAKRLGLGSVLVCNLGAFIATDPKDFARAKDPMGLFNESAIRYVMTSSDLRVIAWGGPLPRKLGLRVGGSMVWMRAMGAHWCLGTTRGGEPRHPLMLPYATPLVHIASGHVWPGFGVAE